jgi:4-hydroxyphenylpyruvate dioxygenase
LNINLLFKYFDIRGVKTGLTSFALQSPDGSFCIPINEATDKKSQIKKTGSLIKKK